ncbi:hypothetical protein ACFQWF_10030 [Methylorubrum suomiense]
MALSAVTVSAFGQWAAALVPDLADLRDRPEAQRVSWRAAFYRRAAAGWHGSSWQWFVWERACRALALVGILAAFALQTDLALTLAARTDRHDTLLPVALVVGAVLSGAGLIAMLAALLRREPGFDGFVTGRHLDILGRLILALGLAGLYCHVTEAVIAGLHGTEAERAIVAQRLTGAEAPAFWTLMLAGLLPTQALWVGAARRSAVTLGLVGALAALGAGAFHLLIVPSDLPSGPASPSPACWRWPSGRPPCSASVCASPSASCRRCRSPNCAGWPSSITAAPSPSRRRGPVPRPGRGSPPPSPRRPGWSRGCAASEPRCRPCISTPTVRRRCRRPPPPSAGTSGSCARRR